MFQRLVLHIFLPKNRPSWSLLILPWLVIAPALSEASQVIKMDLKKLSQEAEVIVVVRCMKCEAVLDTARGRVYSTITFQASQYLKGYLGAQFQVKQLGGVAGNIGTNVPGMPKFVPGREVVLFLSPGTRGGLQVLGMSQGKFEVLTDPQSGEKTVRASSLEGMHLVQTARTRVASSAPTASGAVRLSSFTEQIRQYLKEGN